MKKEKVVDLMDNVRKGIEEAGKALQKLTIAYNDYVNELHALYQKSLEKPEVKDE